jgi:hypothetical protein
MKKILTSIIVLVFLWCGNAYAKNLKMVCTTTETIDGKNAGFYYQLNSVSSEYSIKGIDIIDENLNIKTNKTNIKLKLNKKWSLKPNSIYSNTLMLEDSKTFEDKLLVHTIFLDDLNGIFQSFSTNSKGKTELQKANMSCAMLGSFPF